MITSDSMWAIPTMYAITTAQQAEQEDDAMEETGQTITVDEATAARLAEPGAILTPAMIDETFERLRAAPERNETYDMQMLRAQMVDNTPTLTRTENRQYARPPRGIEVYRDGTGRLAWAVPAREVMADAQPTTLERNATGQLIVELDLAGTALTQNNLDYLYQQLSAAIANHPGETFELRIKRFSTAGGVPRLIADTGFIYELLVKLIDEREEGK